MSKAGPLKIELPRIVDLKRYPENSHTHSPERIEQDNGSIGECGCTTPILIDADNAVIGGCGRMGTTGTEHAHVPAIPMVYLTPEQARDGKPAFARGYAVGGPDWLDGKGDGPEKAGATHA